MTPPVTTIAPLDITAARDAVQAHRTGTVDWMRALVDWFGRQEVDEPRAAAFASVLKELGVVYARTLTLSAPGGQTRDVVQVNLGDESESTCGWAVVDPVNRQVFTSPDGRMAHDWQLRRWPDWVAAERRPAAGDGPEDWMFWASGPHEITFIIGDICNMQCVMCWHVPRRASQPRSAWHPELPASTVREVITRHIDSIDTVEFVSYGEPMANPEFDDMVHLIEALGTDRGRPINLSLITNGSLLQMKRHLDILRLPGYLTFSIDGAERDIYESIRVGGDWQQVIGNLRTALRHPERHPERRIGVNMTVFASNVENVYAMGALAAGLGLDYLSILHGVGLDGLTRADGLQLPRHDPRLVDQIARIRRSFPWLLLNDYTDARDLPALPVDARDDRNFCPLPWRALDIGQTGRARPCCRSHSTDLGPATEAWTGEPLRELRRQILAGEVDGERFSDCAKCPNLGVPVKQSARKVIPLTAA